jgi:hypothetical protein
MRRSTVVAVAAVLMGLMAALGPIHGASAQVPEVPAVPGDLQDIVDQLLDLVGQVTGSLAPEVSFTVDEEAELYSSGAAAGISGTYTCSKTLDLATAPQLAGQSLEFNLNGAYARFDGVAVIAQAHGVINSFDVVCDGNEQEYSITGLTTNGVPFEEGPGEAIVTMTACDLLGCTTASFDPTLNLVGDGFSSGEGDDAATADADCSYSDAGDGSPITADKGDTFTDSRGLSYQVEDDCSLTPL